MWGVDWEAWDVHLASGVVRPRVNPLFFSPSTSLHSLLLGFNLYVAAWCLLIVPSTLCSYSSWSLKKRETLFQFLHIKSHGNALVGLAWVMCSWLNPSQWPDWPDWPIGYSDWPVLGHVPTLQSRQTGPMLCHHGGRDSFPKEERWSGTHKGWLRWRTLTFWPSQHWRVKGKQFS